MWLFLRKYWRYLLPLAVSIVLAIYRHVDLHQNGWKMTPTGERIL